VRHPTGLELFEEDLFWSNKDSNGNKILTANKFLANNSEPTEIVSGLRDMASELHVFHAALQIQSKKQAFSFVPSGVEIPAERHRPKIISVRNDAGKEDPVELEYGP